MVKIACLFVVVFFGCVLVVLMFVCGIVGFVAFVLGAYLFAWWLSGFVFASVRWVVWLLCLIMFPCMLSIDALVYFGCLIVCWLVVVCSCCLVCMMGICCWVFMVVVIVDWVYFDLGDFCCVLGLC